MEFIHGTSLAALIAASVRLDVERARRISIGILEGLRAAHQAGVIHRDLKSDNVMLRTDRGDGLEPVLMDFGLASALNPNESRVSGDQALIGSLAYMAPEQVRGEPLRVATDLYAFGVILFEMLTGRLPFEGPTPAIAAIRRLQEPAPALRSIDPSLSPELERVVARCLERDPKRRYASARSILEALGAPTAEPSSGRPESGASGSRRLDDERASSTDSVSGQEQDTAARSGRVNSEPLLSRGARLRTTALHLGARYLRALWLPALWVLALLAALLLVWWASNAAQ
jgi:serine/threonine protein kinase